MIKMIEKNIPSDIVRNLQNICKLHEQAVCNYEKCREFSENLSDLLIRLEDMKFYGTADRLMSVLIYCKPKEASHCEKANLVGEMMKEVTREVEKAVRIIKIN
jgi:hypothetical protein